MKRWIPLFAILMLNCQASPPDVRNARWGMSPEQVKDTEAAVLASEGESGLQYTDRMDGAIGVDVYYWFHGDALFRVNMKILPETDSLHVDMLRILTEKYGPPAEKDAHEGRLGTTLTRKWKTPRTGITFQVEPLGLVEIWYEERPRTLEESKDLF